MVVPNDEVVARAPQSIEREASSFPAIYMKKKYIGRVIELIEHHNFIFPFFLKKKYYLIHRVLGRVIC